MEAMASCAIAKLTHGLTSRQASSSSCKRCANPSSQWPSSFSARSSRRRSSLLQCKARSLKHAEALDASELQEIFGSQNLQFSDVGGMTVIPSSFSARPSRRRYSQLQCKARSLKHAEALDASELQERFGSQHLLFSDVGGMTVIELKLDSGAAARLLLNEARITSYKCRLWHGSIEEFLHTDVSDPASEITAHYTNGGASSLSPPRFLVTGGIVPSLAYSVSPHLPIFEDKWRVDWVQVDPDEQVQVTLKYVDENRGGWQCSLQCVITLTKHYLASCVVITNNDNKPMTFTGSITTHVAIKATEALCAAGLQGCKYYSPSEAARRLTIKSSMPNPLFGRLKRFVLGESSEKDQVENTTSSVEGTSEMQEQNSGNPYQDQTNWFTEIVADIATVTNGVHKLYSEPSKQIRINDRGFRRSLLFESYGFQNLEISSPELDGEKPFVSIGCSGILSPITVNPKSIWRGAQILGPDTR